MQKKNCLVYIMCRPTEKGLKAFVFTNQFAIKKMAAYQYMMRVSND